MRKYFENKNKRKVFVLLDDDDFYSFGGIKSLFLGESYIMSISEGEKVQKWFINLNPKQDIDIILHTSRGKILDSDIIINCILKHEGRVNIIIPYKAHSLGTRIALSGTMIYMNRYAMMSHVDPIIIQKITLNNSIDINKILCKSYIDILKKIKNDKIETYNIENYARLLDFEKIYNSNRLKIIDILNKRKNNYKREEKNNLVDFLCNGNYDHSSVYNVDQLRERGLKINYIDDANYTRYLDYILNFTF